MNQLVVIHRMKTLFLRYDPGVNSEVSDRVLPRIMLLFKRVECSHVLLHEYSPAFFARDGEARCGTRHY